MNVTPVILTFNEASNIGATLASLQWASRVVVVDSGSTDHTETVTRSFRNADWFVREFDSHRAQWLFGIQGTSITTDYVLALDADMRPEIEFQAELEGFLDRQEFVGASIPFDYRILGRGLMGSIYPAQLRLFLKDAVRVEQPGHSQVFEVSGPTCKFRSRLVHEDLKSLSRWLSNQAKYAALEAARIQGAPQKNFKDWLRTVGVSPGLWGVYAYIKAGGPLRAGASRAYAHERMIFEAILARMLAEDPNGFTKIADTRIDRNT